ncbi:SPP1A [Auxenochlorella protothecoides x Auxenochlorella symbiontica]
MLAFNSLGSLTVRNSVALAASTYPWHTVSGNTGRRALGHARLHGRGRLRASAAETEVAQTAEAPLHVTVRPPLPKLPERELEFHSAPEGVSGWLNQARLAFALPWRQISDGSVMAFTLSGALPDVPQGRFSSAMSMPLLTEALKKAAADPRIRGIAVKIDPLSIGWAKLQELRRHIDYFRESGKFSLAYMERAGEKEYYLASAFEEIYAPPTASLGLRGFSVGGSFLRGVLDKIGVEPEIKRIGKYKSAGDQLLRTDMSDSQREQLSALLDDIYAGFSADVASSRGKTEAEVREMLDAGYHQAEEYAAQGWITGLKYEDEVEELLKQRTGGKEDRVLRAPLRRVAAVGNSVLRKLASRQVIAVVRTAGAINGGGGGGLPSTGSAITAPDVIRQLKAVKDNKKVAAVILRIDSPGGDALASDLMWREIQQLAAKKPVIASMVDVAASGGYYMAMGATHIVAEPLTITGSIGVVTGKFSLERLFERVGFNQTTISRGRYAEALTGARPQSSEEEAWFDEGAWIAYRSFRDRAAASRGVSPDDLEAVAQGRVWSGRQALEHGLVDVLGGIGRALQLAKLAADIPLAQNVPVIEFSRAKVNPLALLSGSRSAAWLPFLAAMSVLPPQLHSAFQSLYGSVAASAGGLNEIQASDGGLLSGLRSGHPLALSPIVEVSAVSSPSSTVGQVCDCRQEPFGGK